MTSVKRFAIAVGFLAFAPFGLTNAADIGTTRLSGVVDQVPNRNDRTIIVSDVVYNVPTSIVVHATATRTISVDLVRVKQKIQFVTNGGGPGVRANITEIWLQ